MNAQRSLMVFPAVKWRRLLLLGCLILSGCGQSRVPVHGKVTLGGGPWPKPGLVRFVRVISEPGASDPGITAKFGTDGRLTFEGPDAEGLPPGTYRIAVECWEREPVYGPGRAYTPQSYLDPKTSGWEITIEPGAGPVEIERDIPNPRRKPR
jgi:hypothetical protein